VDTANLRVLDHEEDAAVCSALRLKVLTGREPDRITNRPWHVAVLEADGFYFVLVSRDRRHDGGQPQRHHRIMVGEHGPPTLFVFDRDLKQIIATRA
jgi:hypothetical protein